MAANTQLYNKIRNPKDLSKWLDIWHIDITDADTYKIYPSDNWVLPTSGSQGGGGQGGGGSDGSTIPTLNSVPGPVGIAVQDLGEEDWTLYLQEVIVDVSLTYNADGTYQLNPTKANVSRYANETVELGQAIVSVTLG